MHLGRNWIPMWQILQDMFSQDELQNIIHEWWLVVSFNSQVSRRFLPVCLLETPTFKSLFIIHAFLSIQQTRRLIFAGSSFDIILFLFCTLKTILPGACFERWRRKYQKCRPQHGCHCTSLNEPPKNDATLAKSSKTPPLIKKCWPQLSVTVNAHQNSWRCRSDIFNNVVIIVTYFV